MDIQSFVDFMQKAGVLRFGEFITKAGRISPYFINTGLYCTGAHLAKLAEYYAELIYDSGEQFDVLFGPAYKGIPLAAVTALELYKTYGIDVKYAFNRKEAKDHGEGGTIIGYSPKEGDRVAVIEDVTSAGTSVRETLDLLRGTATITALYVSVDRCERGKTEKSAISEIRDTYGIHTYKICNAYEILNSLKQDDPNRAKMREYLKQYGER